LTTGAGLSLNSDSLTTGTLLSLTASNVSLTSSSGLLNVENTGSGTSGVLATFKASSAGNSGLFIYQNGRVSIGTGTPGAILDLSGSSDAIKLPSGGTFSGGASASMIRYNTTSSAPEYFNGTVWITVGRILPTGNSFGSTITLGPNDSNILNLVTAGLTRASFGIDGLLTLSAVASNTNTVVDRLIIQTNSSSTASSGFGARIKFQGESSTTNDRDMANIDTAWTTATDASRASYLTLSTVVSTTMTEHLRVANKVTSITGQFVTPRTAAGSAAIDFNNGNVQSRTLTGATAFTFSNPQDGGVYRLILTADAFTTVTPT